MQHDHDVGITLERFSITSLLIFAVTEISLVQKSRQSQFPGQGDCLIRTRVVDQQHLVDYLKRHLVVSLPQRPGGVVGRHDNHDFFAVEHCLSFSARLT